MSRSHPPARVLVLRHGESEWNAQGRWQGQADPPLTETGMLQAVEAAEQLGMFDAVWASSLQRAAHTAAILCEVLGIGPVQIEPRLIEAGFGPWEGLTVHQIEAKWPGYVANHHRPEGAEAVDAVSQRALAGIRDIGAQSPGCDVLVVTHAGVIRAIRRELGAPDRRYTNLTGCWFEVHHDGRIEVGDDVELTDPTTLGDTL